MQTKVIRGTSRADVERKAADWITTRLGIRLVHLRAPQAGGDQLDAMKEGIWRITISYEDQPSD
jgi:hypothetical protein